METAPRTDLHTIVWFRGDLRVADNPALAAAAERAADTSLKASLRDSGATVQDFSASLLFEPGSVTTSLSPHLRWGEVSPHQVWQVTTDARRRAGPKRADGATRFLSELGWREFAAHVSFHASDLVTTSWRPEFEAGRARRIQGRAVGSPARALSIVRG